MTGHQGQGPDTSGTRRCCQIVRPSTILAWFRLLAAKKYDSSEQRRKLGRPRKHNNIRESVIKLARENLGWGYTKIRDALRGLKVEIGRTTVVNILAEAGIEPAPERKNKRTWAQFIRSLWLPKTHPQGNSCCFPHVAMMKATDFWQFNYLPQIRPLNGSRLGCVAFQRQVAS